MLSALVLLAGMIVVVGVAPPRATSAAQMQGPAFSVNVTTDNVWSGDNDWRFDVASAVTITVARGGVPQGSWPAPLDGYGHFGTQLTDFDLRAGDVVTVDNQHEYVTTHTVLEFTAVPDVSNQTVSGTADVLNGTSGAAIARAPDGSNPCERVFSVTGGQWAVDFSGCGVPVTPFRVGNPWTNAEPTHGEASFLAPDGTTEALDWQLPSTSFTADPASNQVSTPPSGCSNGTWGTGPCGWRTGSVDIEVWHGGDPDAGGSASGVMTFPIDTNGHFYAQLNGFDLQPGDIVRVSDGIHPTKQLNMANPFAVTAVNVGAQTVTGTANAENGSTVVVDANNFGNPGQHCRQYATVTGGVFTADFSASAAVPCNPAIAFVTGDPWTNGSSTFGSAYLPDSDNDATQANWQVASIAFTADAASDQVSNYAVGGCPNGSWGGGTCGAMTGSVQISVWRGTDPNIALPTFGPVSQGVGANGHFSINLGYDLLPGDIVRVSDGVHAFKQLTVAAGFAVTAIDPATKTVKGTASAPDNTTVVVDAHSLNQGCRKFTTVTAGTFTANFSAGCNPPIDFVTGDPWTNGSSTGGSAFLLDSDRDATQINWSLSVPVFQANPDQDMVSSGPGCQWGNGSCGSNTGTMSLTIRRGGTQVFPASGSATVPIPPTGNWQFNLVDQPYNTGPWKFDFKVGDEITVTDGTHTKTLIVSSIKSFGADPLTNQVFGTANPVDGNVLVFVAAFSNPPAPCTRASATFDGTTWIADFDVPACFDLTAGSGGSAQQIDADGDASVANWQVPNFSVSPQGDQVMGFGWGPGNTVNVSITPLGGVTQGYTVVVPTTSSPYSTPGSFQLCTNQGNMPSCTTVGSPALDIEPGATVTISHVLPDGTTLSSTHVVTALIITGVDVANNVVRGRATPGIDVQVSAQASGSPGTPENHTVTPNAATGEWSQAFVLDIVAGTTNVSASQVDPVTGNRTQVGWWSGQPQLVLSPSSNFADHTVVTVQGIGWRPGAPISISQCKYPVGGTQDCAPASTMSVTADPNFGDFNAQITLATHIQTNGGETVDCTGGYAYCALAVSTTDVSYPDPGAQFQIVPLVFGTQPTPTMTVTKLDGSPATNLNDGDTIRVTLSGYPRNTYINLFGQCTAAIQVPFWGGQTIPFCFARFTDPSQQPMTDANGHLTIELRVSKFLIAGGTYTVTPNTGLVDGQTVTVTGQGYQVADCSTPAAACYFQAGVYQGGSTSVGAAPVQLTFATNAVGPALEVRQNLLGHVQGGTPPEMYSYVVWGSHTAGGIPVTLVDQGETWGFSTQYTVHRNITVLPGPPFDPSLDTLTNPIDCAALPTGLPEGNWADCVIDAVPPDSGDSGLGYVMSQDGFTAPTLQFTTSSVTAMPVTTSTNEDTSKWILLTGTDTSGKSMTFTVVSGPAHGSVRLGDRVCWGGTPRICIRMATYTPVANFNGLDEFTYLVSNGTSSSSVATVSITVRAVNDAPTLSYITDKSVQRNHTTSFNVTIGDVDDPTETLTISSTASSKVTVTISGSGPTRTVTIRAGSQTGKFEVKIRVTDPHGATATRTFMVTVTR